MPIALDLPTVAFLLIVCVLMPLGAWHGYRKLKRGTPLPPKSQRFRSMVMMLVAVVIWALMAAESNRVELSFRVAGLDVLLGIAISALLLLVVERGWRKLEPARRERVLLLYGAENRAQLGWTIAGAFGAGIGEEIVYRGVLFALLSRLTSSILLGMALSILLFALAHATQGLKSMLAVAYLGLVFHLCCFLTGSLVTAMIIHTIYDLGMFIRLYREHQRSTALPQAEAEAVGAGH